MGSYFLGVLMSLAFVIQAQAEPNQIDRSTLVGCLSALNSGGIVHKVEFNSNSGGANSKYFVLPRISADLMHFYLVSEDGNRIYQCGQPPAEGGNPSDKFIELEGVKRFFPYPEIDIGKFDINSPPGPIRYDQNRPGRPCQILSNVSNLKERIIEAISEKSGLLCDESSCPRKLTRQSGQSQFFRGIDETTKKLVARGFTEQCQALISVKPREVVCAHLFSTSLLTGTEEQKANQLRTCIDSKDATSIPPSPEKTR